MNVKLVIKRLRRRPIKLLAVFHMQTAALLIQYLQMIFIELKVSGWPFKIKETLVCFSNAWQLIRCEMMYLNCKITSQTIRAVFQQPQNEFFQHSSTDSLTGFQTSNGGWIDKTEVYVSVELIERNLFALEHHLQLTVVFTVALVNIYLPSVVMRKWTVRLRHLPAARN